MTCEPNWVSTTPPVAPGGPGAGGAGRGESEGGFGEDGVHRATGARVGHAAVEDECGERLDFELESIVGGGFGAGFEIGVGRGGGGAWGGRRRERRRRRWPWRARRRRRPVSICERRWRG